MKIGAVGILSTMLLGLLAWAGNQIVDNGEKIARLEEREKSHKELLIEVRGDVKQILKRMK